MTRMFDHGWICFAIFSFAILVNAVQTHPAQTTFVATEDGDRPIGTIKWVIQDTTGNVLDQGETALILKDVSIQELPLLEDILPGLPPVSTGISVSKRVRLNDQFTFVE